MFIKTGKISDRELRMLRDVVSANHFNFGAATLYSSSKGIHDNKDHRKCTTFFSKHGTEEYECIAKSIYPYILQNYYNIGVDLTSFAPEIQFVKYNVGEFFAWHNDSNQGKDNIRVFTFSINLSDEKNYEGGELRVRQGDKTFTLDKTPGSFIIFPSFLLHKAYPVLKGQRTALVVWAYTFTNNFKKFQQKYEELQKTKA